MSVPLGSTVGIAQMPEFKESLRLLVESEQYALADIGLMFGVSRERIRQLCERFGFMTERNNRRGLYAIRVWDDAANRFLPVSRGTYQDGRRRKAAGERHAAYLAVVAERRASIVEKVTALRASLQREPTTREIVVAIGGSLEYGNDTMAILARWPLPRVRSTREKLRDFRRATGTRPVALGRPTAAHYAPDPATSEKASVEPTPPSLPPRQTPNDT